MSAPFTESEMLEWASGIVQDISGSEVIRHKRISLYDDAPFVFHDFESELEIRWDVGKDGCRLVGLFHYLDKGNVAVDVNITINSENHVVAVNLWKHATSPIEHLPRVGELIVQADSEVRVPPS